MRGEAVQVDAEELAPQEWTMQRGPMRQAVYENSAHTRRTTLVCTETLLLSCIRFRTKAPLKKVTSMLLVLIAKTANAFKSATGFVSVTHIHGVTPTASRPRVSETK